MPSGYNGKILLVNLTSKKLKVEEPEEVFYRTYLGGGSLASYYLLRHMPPGIDALAPENTLIFASNVISGVPIAGMACFTVAAQSPLTGGYGESEGGGFWGPELKFSGFDAIVITGKAEKPSYLNICEGKVELHSAQKLWSLETGPTQERIRKDLKDDRVRVAVIGPAGENLVRTACVVNELKHVNGVGLGAVMGSKNLKAIAVRGTNKLWARNLEGFLEISQSLGEFIGQYGPDRALRKTGTTNLVLALNTQGILPTRNFRGGVFAGAEKISEERMAETIVKSEEGCYACAARCKRMVEIPAGPYATSSEYGAPQYETLAALGSLLCIDDLEVISKGNELCNRYGVDTTSIGAAIGFTMECYEKGILTKADTEGVEFRFGNAEAMLQAIEWIAFRKRGLGDLLADGVKTAAEKIGQGSEKFALHVKGQELPMVDPRANISQALSFAVFPTGAAPTAPCHDGRFENGPRTISWTAPLGLMEPTSALDFGPRRVRHDTYLQFVRSLFNSLGVCNFAAGPASALPLNRLVELVRAVTGWDTSLWDLLKVGERKMTSARVFNLREGFGRKDDTLPDRFFAPLENGSLQGKPLDRKEFEDGLTMYYESLGWDSKEGIPTRGRLAELNLYWLDEFLKGKRGKE